jgi:hypothetical protein
MNKEVYGLKSIESKFFLIDFNRIFQENHEFKKSRESFREFTAVNKYKYHINKRINRFIFIEKIEAFLR